MLAEIRNFGGKISKLKKVESPDKAAVVPAAAAPVGGGAGQEQGKSKSSGGGGVDLMADLKAKLNRRRSGIGGNDATGTAKAQGENLSAKGKLPPPASLNASAADSPASQGMASDMPSALSAMQGLGTAIAKQRKGQDEDDGAEWSDGE